MSTRRRSAIRVLGVMTGTSCDGLDAACIEIDGTGWAPLWGDSRPYPPRLRHEVLALQEPGNKIGAYSWLELHRRLGEWYGREIQAMLTQKRRHGELPDVIANHGQTIAHFPASGHRGSTLQMGDPTRIAYATGLTVVSNFREGDMAAGGQGAPLVPLFHRLLAHSLGKPSAGISIHNIGGISNLTYIGPKGRVLAFDTGPGNIWIDAAAQIVSRGRLKMDLDGRFASQAEPDRKAVERLLKHAYFSRAAPKSTGRDEFVFDLLLKATPFRDASLVATATAVTVESIGRSYEQTVIRKRLPLKHIFLCGGGARNPALMSGIQARLPDVAVATVESLGLDSQMLEAQAFAFFGFLSLLGQPLGGSWTGARGFGPPGHVVPGGNWTEVLSKARALSPLFSSN